MIEFIFEHRSSFLDRKFFCKKCHDLIRSDSCTWLGCSEELPPRDSYICAIRRAEPGDSCTKCGVELGKNIDVSVNLVLRSWLLSDAGRHIEAREVMAQVPEEVKNRAKFEASKRSRAWKQKHREE